MRRSCAVRRCGLWLIVVALVLGMGVGGRALAQDGAAEAADASWLRLVDAGQYAKSWRAAAKSFQGAITKADWEKAVRGARSPLGAMKTRALAEAKRTSTLPGAPDGEYVVSVFDTSFEHKAAARETVTAVREKDGSWRVAGYYIK